jgi:hypothetical protein
MIAPAAPKRAHMRLHVLTALLLLNVWDHRVGGARSVGCCCPGSITVPTLPVLRLRGGQPACYYELLGLNKMENPARVRAAYLKKALKCHPDRAPPEKKEQAERAFKALKEAYDVLMDPFQRQAYDMASAGAQHAGFSAHHSYGDGAAMPSARPEDMPSAFDSLGAWEKYFGVSFSEESFSEDDKAESAGELKQLEEALERICGTPTGTQDMSSERDIASMSSILEAWEKYLGLEHRGAEHDETPDQHHSSVSAEHFSSLRPAPKSNSDVISQWEKYLGLGPPPHLKSDTRLQLVPE